MSRETGSRIFLWFLRTVQMFLWGAYWGWHFKAPALFTYWGAELFALAALGAAAAYRLPQPQSAQLLRAPLWCGALLLPQAAWSPFLAAALCGFALGADRFRVIRRFSSAAAVICGGIVLIVLPVPPEFDRLRCLAILLGGVLTLETFCAAGPKRIGQWIASGVALLFLLSGFYLLNPQAKAAAFLPPAPLAVSAALASLTPSEMEEHSAEIALIGGDDEFQEECREYGLEFSYFPSPDDLRGKYDLILLLTSGSPRIPAACLNPGGVIVMPEKNLFCFPEMRWVRLPGEGYVAGNRERDFTISPAAVDEFCVQLLDIPAGTVEGLLVDYRPEVVAEARLPWGPHSPHWAWLLLLLPVIPEVAAFRRPRFADALAVLESALEYTLLAGVLIGSYVSWSNRIDCILISCCWFAWYFVRLPLRPWIDRLCGVAALALALLWLGNADLVREWGPLGELLVLFFAGPAFAAEQRRLNENGMNAANGSALFAGIVLGALLVRLLPGVFRVPVAALIYTAAALRLWTILRN